MPVLFIHLQLTWQTYSSYWMTSFQAEENPIYQRREDIKSLLLNSENTFSLTPYLDIVNEILESKVEGDTYEVLKQTNYPLNLPFHLENEKVKKALQILNITPEQLYKLFAERQDLKQETIAREHLGLSLEEMEIIRVPSSGNTLKSLYGHSGTYAELQNITTFLEATGLSGAELRELVYQNLNEEEKEAKLADHFLSIKVLADSQSSMKTKKILPKITGPILPQPGSIGRSVLYA